MSGDFPELTRADGEHCFYMCLLVNVCTSGCILSKACCQCYIPSGSKHQGRPVFTKNLVLFKQPNCPRLISNNRTLVFCIKKVNQ